MAVCECGDDSIFPVEILCRDSCTGTMQVFRSLTDIRIEGNQRIKRSRSQCQPLDCRILFRYIRTNLEESQEIIPVYANRTVLSSVFLFPMLSVTIIWRSLVMGRKHILYVLRCNLHFRA